MINIKTREEIELMRESALVVSKTLGMLAAEIKPGVTTLQLDKLAEEFIREQNAEPGFLGLYDFPNTLCMSPNAQVVHGIPNATPLVEGDIISIDCGAIKNGFYGDHAYTFAVGEISQETQELLKVTKESLYVGINEFKVGNRVGDVGYAIQKYCEDYGYGVVRELVGHGLGTKMHEEPDMPNYGQRGRGKKFIEGMVVAIEPMINQGTRRITQLKDGWTILTADNKPSAHFEHNVAIVDGKPELLSTFKYIYNALGIESTEEDKFRSKYMIKNYRQEQWKTLHKDIWQDRFIYKISNYGRVLSFVKNPEGELLSGGKTAGYLSFVVVLKTGKNKSYYFHRAIAELFLEKAEDDQYVIHKNYKKHENQVSNLAWVNKEEWTKHQFDNPSVKENKQKRKLRQSTSYSKLTYAQAVILKKKLLDPNRKTRIRVLAKQFGVSEMQLYRIKSGENWGDIEV